MIAEILIGIVSGLLANELCDFSPWSARKLVHWSAFRRYADPGRAEIRAEELTALINDRPGNLFKLITAAGFAGAAVIVSARRAVGRGTDTPDPCEILAGLSAGAGVTPDLIEAWAARLAADFPELAGRAQGIVDAYFRRGA